jgi:hypothetical protein
MSSLNIANQSFDWDFTYTYTGTPSSYKYLNTSSSNRIMKLYTEQACAHNTHNNRLCDTSLRIKRAHTVPVPFCDWQSYRLKSLIFMLMRRKWSRIDTCQPQSGMQLRSPTTRIQGQEHNLRHQTFLKSHSLSSQSDDKPKR